MIISFHSSSFIAVVLTGFVAGLCSVIADFFIRRPAEAVKDLRSKKIELKIQLASIKSIQLEFVKHSLLTRNTIKLDKDLEDLTASHNILVQKRLKYFNITQVFLIVAIALGFRNASLVSIDSNILSPVSWLFYRRHGLLHVPAVVLFILSSLVARLIARRYASL